MEKIYVIGHKNPDTDSVVSAIAMAYYLNERDRVDIYVPAIAGSMNPETSFVFNKFAVEMPTVILDGKDKRLFLVDHNEATQIIDGHSMTDIVGVVDHHKFNFNHPEPIEIISKPWGSTSSIIYYLFKSSSLSVPEHLRPVILSAILSDTIILKSPTTTEVDRQVVDTLSQELDVSYEELGTQLFEAKGSIADKPANQIIETDLKEFKIGEKVVGVAQVETPNISSIEARFLEIIEEMRKIKINKGYHSIMMLVTDILKEGSTLLVVSDEEEKIAKLFETEIENNISLFIPGLISRKKQITPLISENL